MVVLHPQHLKRLEESPNELKFRHSFEKQNVRAPVCFKANPPRRGFGSKPPDAQDDAEACGHDAEVCSHDAKVCSHDAEVSAAGAEVSASDVEASAARARTSGSSAARR